MTYDVVFIKKKLMELEIGTGDVHCNKILEITRYRVKVRSKVSSLIQFIRYLVYFHIILRIVDEKPFVIIA